MALPLKGLRVIDLTKDFAGPFCTMILSDLGAEVIKVEKPGSGDETRAWGPPFVKGLSYYFLSLNRGKRSITGEEGRPSVRVSIPVADIAAGHYASTAILAYLSRRLVTGRGGYIDISLFDSIVSWLSYLATYYFATGKEPKRMGSAHPSIVPYQAFMCKDREIIIAVGNDQQFQRLCQSLGLEKLSEERRFNTNPQRVRNRQQLVSILSRRLKKQSAAYWNKLLNQNRIPSAPVYKISDVARDPQIKHRGLFKKMKSGIPQMTSPIKLFKQEKRSSSPAPTLGQDTTQVLRELGYSKHAINRIMGNKAS